MADLKRAATTGVGIAGGVGSTLLIRDRFDQTGETTLLRPSILWSAATGAVAMSVPMVAGGSGPVMTAATTYGIAALSAATFIALQPKSGSIQTPSL